MCGWLLTMTAMTMATNVPPRSDECSSKKSMNFKHTKRHIESNPMNRKIVNSPVVCKRGNSTSKSAKALQ